MITLDFAVESDLWAGLPEAEALAGAALAVAEKLAGKKLHPEAEVSLVLTDDATIRALNKNWRKIDKATNVLSFPAADLKKLAQSPLLGDIILSFETLAREAAEESKTLDDHYSHLTIHGFLHLLGFDHETVAEAEEMEALEINILAALNIADPYADTEPSTSP
jgi:probable rRNA maturation factor